MDDPTRPLPRRQCSKDSCPAHIHRVPDLHRFPFGRQRPVTEENIERDEGKRHNECKQARVGKISGETQKGEDRVREGEEEGRNRGGKERPRDTHGLYPS